MVNKAIIVGRVGKEPRSFEGKTPMVSFSVATDSGYGENKVTIWENIKVFGKTAEACAKYLEKGSLVYVEGRREQATKDDKTYSSVVANEVKFLSQKSKDEEKPKAQAKRKPEADDDIPL